MLWAGSGQGWDARGPDSVPETRVTGRHAPFPPLPNVVRLTHLSGPQSLDCRTKQNKAERTARSSKALGLQRWVSAPPGLSRRGRGWSPSDGTFGCSLASLPCDAERGLRWEPVLPARFPLTCLGGLLRTRGCRLTCVCVRVCTCVYVCVCSSAWKWMIYMDGSGRECVIGSGRAAPAVLRAPRTCPEAVAVLCRGAARTPPRSLSCSSG